MLSSFASAGASLAWSEWPWLTRIAVAPATASPRRSAGNIGLPDSHGSTSRIWSAISIRNPECPSHVSFICNPPRAALPAAAIGGEHRWTGFARSTTIANGSTTATGPSRSTRSRTRASSIAALIAWRLIGARRDPGARLLTLVLAAIGVGSYLFHTHAQVWALIARRRADPGLHPDLRLSRDHALLRAAVVGGRARGRALHPLRGARLARRSRRSPGR